MYVCNRSIHPSIEEEEEEDEEDIYACRIVTRERERERERERLRHSLSPLLVPNQLLIPFLCLQSERSPWILHSSHASLLHRPLL